MPDGPIGKLRMAVVPVDDMAAAVSFYGGELGLELVFQDGDRWAMLRAGDFVVSLADRSQHPDGESVALAFKTDDVEASLRRVVDAGGTVVKTPSRGEHEISASVREPNGSLLILYSDLPG